MRIGQLLGEASGKIGHLYEAHIRPFIPFGIQGVLWDQDESGMAITRADRYPLMGALIRGTALNGGRAISRSCTCRSPAAATPGSHPTR